ncbi:MAG: hypothetical protein P0116_01930 [Candidatus Nitrosocosmicus sp.]|nr:hypothetical protein [Candidatus Nitrosocosmicus sp.]
MVLSPFEQIFAQIEDNNMIGQDVEGTDASQSEDNSQEIDQNSQCVSGDSNFFSCNNGSSNSIGTSEQGTPGIGFPGSAVMTKSMCGMEIELLRLVLARPFRP